LTSAAKIFKAVQESIFESNVHPKIPFFLPLQGKNLKKGSPLPHGRENKWMDTK
jgi:hypothetical protein